MLKKLREYQLAVSLNAGTPKSSILIGFSIINHPFWGTTIFGNTQLKDQSFFSSRIYCRGFDTRSPDWIVNNSHIYGE